MAQFVLSFFLKIGHTSADFNMSGNIPSDRDLLIIMDRGPIRCSLNSFSILVGRLKGPHDLKFPNSEMISSISPGVQGWRKTLFGILSPRWVLKLFGQQGCWLQSWSQY